MKSIYDNMIQTGFIQSVTKKYQDLFSVLLHDVTLSVNLNFICYSFKLCYLINFLSISYFTIFWENIKEIVLIRCTSYFTSKIKNKKDIKYKI